MNNKSTEKQENKTEKPHPKPNENVGFHFSSFLKIFDPNTKKIIVQKRGDF